MQRTQRAGVEASAGCFVGSPRGVRLTGSIQRPHAFGADGASGGLRIGASIGRKLRWRSDAGLRGAKNTRAGIGRP